MTNLDIIFKAYDIRGQIDTELDLETVYKIAQAYASWLKPKQVVIGHDIRLSSPKISHTFSLGLTEAGVDVIDIGLCGTEEVYFAINHLKTDGGVMVTASHNPKTYNGLKLMMAQAQSISEDSGLKDIKNIIKKSLFSKPKQRGSLQQIDLKDQYIQKLLTYIDIKALKPLKIVSNPGNGGAGLIVDRLEKYLPFEFIKIRHQANGRFPNGVPNPLLPTNRQINTDHIKEGKAHLGLAWDGDFDRCFLFDETGKCIEGYYIVGLLSKFFLKQRSNAKIIHDSSLFWNTQEVIKKYKGQAIQSKNGHSFIKARMKSEDAIYGGEMSGHHYFKDFFYCDSGMIPWLLISQMMSESNKSLSNLTKSYILKFPISGEINMKIKNPELALNKIIEHYQNQSLFTDTTDGLGFNFKDWRFNIRKSNTEPLLRLNIESKNDSSLVKSKINEISKIIGLQE